MDRGFSDSDGPEHDGAASCPQVGPDTPFPQQPVRPLTGALAADTSVGEWEESRKMKRQAVSESMSLSPLFSGKL